MEDCDRWGRLGYRSSPEPGPARQPADKKCKSATTTSITLLNNKPQVTLMLSPVILLKTSLVAMMTIMMISLECKAQQQQQQPHQSQPTTPNEYQLVGQAGSLVWLPCLIGKQAHCGEPYFIAWYKLNATSRQWTRLEARSPSDQDQEGEEELLADRRQPAMAQPAVGQPRPLADRVQFIWSRSSQSPMSSSCFLADGTNQTMSAGPMLTNRLQLANHQAQQLQATSGTQSADLALLSAFQLFDCAQLAIKQVELQDEGQYKCEITFSESVEFDRCPASTMTQLNVIARPNEPEILLNGRPATSLATHQAGNGLTFKEGAQVRLECQSAGGKPAPRIEWLNLTTWTGTSGSGGRGLGGTLAQLAAASAAAATTKNETRAGNSMKLNDDQSMDSDAAARRQLEASLNDGGGELPLPQQAEQLVQLMRLHWPIKRATYSVNSYDSLANNQQLNNNINQMGPQQQQQQLQIPVTSSSITITLSRYDLRSRFACLVLPQPSSSTHNNNHNNLISGSNNQAGELQLLNELPASLRNARALNQAASQVPMLANTRLQSPDGPMLKWVQLNVLAKPTSVSIRVLELSPMGADHFQQASHQLVRAHQASSKQPFYSLHPNRLYAIQCLVENSRPSSQVAWFNRTAPVELSEPTVELDTADYLVPSQASNHRLTSFVRHIEQEWGTFRTVSTLLLTTNFHDNFHELFCRVSNEAFQFDELAQVAPIISARIYVNYPPSAWLEAPDVDWTTSPSSATTTSSNSDNNPATNNKLGRLSGELGQRLQLRCFVGANPMLQNTIVQIDWLKDGRRLTTSSMSNSGGGGVGSTASASKLARIQIEKANHLHMPLASQQQLEQLAASRLATNLGSAGFSDPTSESSASGGLAVAANARLLTASSLTISDLAKSDAGAYSCQFKLIPAPSTSAGLQQVASGGQANVSLASATLLFQQQQQQQQARIISGQSGHTIQLTVIEARLPVVRVSSKNGLFVYDRTTSQKRTRNNNNKPSGYHRQRLEVVVAEPSAELSLKCDHHLSQARHRAPSLQQQQPLLGANNPAELGRRVLWYLNGAFVHSSASNDELVLKPAAEPGELVEASDDAASIMRLKLLAGNGGRLSCAHQTLESTGAIAAAPGNFHASSMRLFPSANELDLRFKVEPKLLPADERRELLMPRFRSFSELELAAQPLNKLKLVCLAQCEPVCSINWLLNRQPIGKLEMQPNRPNQEQLQQLAQVQEIADNQTRIFKSAGRLEATLATTTLLGPASTLMESPLATSASTTAGSSLPLSLVQVDNLIHRKTASSLERFPWYKQTSFVPAATSAASPSPTEMATQVELASRQLMRDSYELANGLAAQAGPSGGGDRQQPPLSSNVFSKLELSYNQISRLLSDIGSRGHISRGANQQGGPLQQQGQPLDGDELLVECKLDETFGGRHEQFGSAHVKPDDFYPYLRGDQHRLWAAGESEDNDDHEQQQSDFSLAALNFDQVELSSLLAPAGGGGGGRSRQASASMAANSFQTRIHLERPSQPQMTGSGSIGSSSPRATLAFPLDEPMTSQDGAHGHAQTHQTTTGSFALLNPQLSSNLSQQNEAQLKFSTGQQQLGQPKGGHFTRTVRDWLVGYQERILVGVSVLVIVWLVALFASPLVQRYFLGSPKLGGLGRDASTAAASRHHQNRTTNWRFNKQHNLSSRTSSTNEIGTGGQGGGGSSSSSSSMMAHKFGLQEPPPTFGFGLASTANYYGPAESSEHDMVQSCSQSSNYEEFIQHQIQQRLLHQQPLYFNQAQLVESTTLSRRPLVHGSSSATDNELSATQSSRQQSGRQSHHQPATMRHNLSNVPLISGLGSGTSSRINFSDLQRHSRGLLVDRNASGPSSMQTQRHHYSFGKIPLQPSISGGSVGQQRPSNLQEHIYDDVS